MQRWAGKRAQSERDIQNQSVGVLLKSKCQVRITHTDVRVFVRLESLAEVKTEIELIDRVAKPSELPT